IYIEKKKYRDAMIWLMRAHQSGAYTSATINNEIKKCLHYDEELIFYLIGCSVENYQLKSKIKEQEIELCYRPGGVGYEKAKEHFYSECEI
ncbi:MAG: hypothetical protein Harvfovirus38_1, partial [Harvfovirus sp.]